MLTLIRKICLDYLSRGFPTIGGKPLDDSILLHNEKGKLPPIYHFSKSEISSKELAIETSANATLLISEPITYAPLISPALSLFIANPLCESPISDTNNSLSLIAAYSKWHQIVIEEKFSSIIISGDIGLPISDSDSITT